MSEILLPVILAAMGAGGIGAAAVNAWAGRGKTKADVTATLTEAQRQYSDDLREDMAALRNRLIAAEARIEEQAATILKLRDEMLTLRHNAAEAASVIAGLTQERDRYRAEAERLSQVEAEQQARIIELEARVRDLESRLARVENSNGGVV